MKRPILFLNLREYEKKKILNNTESKDFFISTFDRNLPIINDYEIAKVEFSNFSKTKPTRYFNN